MQSVNYNLSNSDICEENVLILLREMPHYGSLLLEYLNRLLSEDIAYLIPLSQNELIEVFDLNNSKELLDQIADILCHESLREFFSIFKKSWEKQNQ